ncbi:hypothetical protein [Polyangium sp. 15x6]|uniref:hypothetical protein n=1 Tax=Polyangium sp. 15x6 TaxID=3042687 RepID=UPI00249AB315|nr:hypothetical protein [Polyangium sp. 15x6]MDI3289348.1 hypothetical protein [Polyangium sp. 15x6]
MASVEQLLCTDVGNSCGIDADCCTNQCWWGTCQCVATTDWGCTKDADCCNGGACYITAPATIGTCRLPDGAPCTHGDGESESCNSHVCWDGVCATCALTQSACGGDNDCCQGDCRSGGCCQPPGGACGSDDDCCVGTTGYCYQGACHCIYIGDWGCDKDSDCCAADVDGTICNTNGKCCIPEGMPAIGESGCCTTGIRNGLCATCKEGGSCTQDSDCCSNSCINGACHECVGAGRADCTQDADCCGNDCRSDGFCCALKYMGCGTNSDCCSNSCVNGTCE